MDKHQSVISLRKKLKKGGHSIGGWMQLNDTGIAEMMGNASFDWVAVDLEHGTATLNHLPDIFRALELGSTLPLARLSNGNISECKSVLDAGAAGVIIPMVSTADQLSSIRENCCWPPAGQRGVAFSRANLFGKHFAQYTEQAQEPLIIAMIEQATAVENIDEILQVEGLDAIIVGPYDLSASLGIVAQFDNPKFKDAMERILNASNCAGVSAGLHIVEPSLEQIQSRIAQGYRFFAYSIDTVLIGNSLKEFDKYYSQ